MTEVVAGALPAEKVELSAAFRNRAGRWRWSETAVNDGPALVVADLGLAVGSGTDVAINAADLIVVRDDLRCCDGDRSGPPHAQDDPRQPRMGIRLQRRCHPLGRTADS